MLHFPHPTCRNAKTIHRLCVLPDYQGIGVGTKMLDVVAKHYKDAGYQVKITTSAKNLIAALNRRNGWKLTRYGKSVGGKTIDKEFAKTVREGCKTATFFCE